MMHYFICFDVSNEIDTQKIITDFGTSRYGPRIIRSIKRFIRIEELPVNFLTEKTDEYELSVKIYPTGTVMFSFSFKEEKLDPVYIEEKVKKLKEIAKEKLKKLREKIEKYCKGYKIFENPFSEDYLVIVLPYSPRTIKRKRFLAGLIKLEKDYKKLSREEIKNTLSTTFSYYEKEKIIIGPYVTLIITNEDYEDYLAVIEFTLKQFTELKSYNYFLDKILEDAKNKRISLNKIILLRIDFAETVERTMNVTEIFEEAYLARFYRIFAERIGVFRYYQEVLKKLEEISKICNALVEQRIRRLELLVEILILLVIILEVIIFL